MNQPFSFQNQAKQSANEKQQVTPNSQISNNFQKIQIPALIQQQFVPQVSQVKPAMNQQFPSFISKQNDQEAKNFQINSQKIEESKKELQQQFQKDINELENKINALLKQSLEKVNLETQVQVLEQQELKKEIDNLKKHILRLENQQSQQNDSDKSENFEQIKSSVLDQNDQNNIQDIISQIENFKKDIQKDQDFFHFKLSKLESKNKATQEQVKQIQQLNDNFQNQNILLQTLNSQKDQLNQNTENIFGLQQSIKRIEQQMNIQKLQTQTQNFQIAEFYQATEYIYLTNLSDQDKCETQFEFIVEEDEIPFTIGIIQDGDLENQDSKTKFLQIQFPLGQLIRGTEDPINFLPRQILRNDRIQMKVLKEKELFLVTLNGIDIPPIKIKEDLSNQHTFVVKSEYPLQEIISQDGEF